MRKTETLTKSHKQDVPKLSPSTGHHSSSQGTVLEPRSRMPPGWFHLSRMFPMCTLDKIQVTQVAISKCPPQTSRPLMLHNHHGCQYPERSHSFNLRPCPHEKHQVPSTSSQSVAGTLVLLSILTKTAMQTEQSLVSCILEQCPWAGSVAADGTIALHPRAVWHVAHLPEGTQACS